MTALQVGAPGERHFGTVKKCYPCCRIKVLPMLPVDQRKPVLSQGAERCFIKKLVFPNPAGHANCAALTPATYISHDASPSVRLTKTTDQKAVEGNRHMPDRRPCLTKTIAR